MSLLEKIKSPADIRVLSVGEMNELAAEIRRTIIDVVAENGGHLASNLGMVEAEIALHRVFDAPDDTLVFDVGHQAYAHKLLTGRYDRFSTLRQSGGISGFTNRSESQYDAVTAGHSGTALSTAVGIAEANRLAGNGRWTVAVIGDGSFTNGMVYEALNQLDKTDLRLIVLLNDNAMSISENVGGMSNYFSFVRTSHSYFSFKMILKRVFGAIPLIGKGLVTAAGAIKDFLKRLLGAETWFEFLGLDYIGPVNGNDIAKLTSVLEEAKRKKKPVVVHMMTKKGAGFLPAEEHPERYHSTSGFDPATGTPKCGGTKTFTDVFSETMLRMAERNSSLVAITAAMTDGCGLAAFAEAYPDRFFDVGIAEEHAVTFASGLSIGSHGKLTPVLALYSTFSQRVFDQLWHDFCLQNAEKNDLSLILMLSHAGLVPGDGVTHQGIYDVALLSRLPGITVYSPDTFAEWERAFEKATAARGLTVIRYPKSGEACYEASFTDRDEWKYTSFGKEQTEVVVTYGRIAERVVRTAKRHAEQNGCGVTVAVLERIVPLPTDDAFASLVRNAERVTVVEEALASGGIGETLAAHFETKRKIHIAAIKNGFIRCGRIDEITAAVGLDEEGIAKDL